MGWTHSASAVLASFLASLVEFVEALTIVLAVGVTRGWRSAIAGALLGAALLTVLVAIFGTSLQLVPIRELQFFVGLLLLVFGMRWLSKAILRASGVLGLHDETKIFARIPKHSNRWCGIHYQLQGCCDRGNGGRVYRDCGRCHRTHATASQPWRTGSWPLGGPSWTRPS